MKEYDLIYARNQFEKLEMALEKFNPVAFDKLKFEIYPALKNGNFVGKRTYKYTNVEWYELKLPSDKMFPQIQDEIKLVYSVHKNYDTILLQDITPADYLLSLSIAEEKDTPKEEQNNKEDDKVEINDKSDELIYQKLKELWAKGKIREFYTMSLQNDRTLKISTEIISGNKKENSNPNDTESHTESNQPEIIAEEKDTPKEEESVLEDNDFEKLDEEQEISKPTDTESLIESNQPKIIVEEKDTSKEEESFLEDDDFEKLDEELDIPNLNDTESFIESNQPEIIVEENDDAYITTIVKLALRADIKEDASEYKKHRDALFNLPNSCDKFWGIYELVKETWYLRYLLKVEDLEKMIFEMQNPHYIAIFWHSFSYEISIRKFSKRSNAPDSKDKIDEYYEDTKIVEKYLNKYIEPIIQTQNPEYIAEFAIRNNPSYESFKKLEDALVNLPNSEKKAKCICWLMKESVSQKDMKKLEKALIKTGNIYYIMEMARSGAYENIAELNDAIIQLNPTPYEIYDLICLNCYRHSSYYPTEQITEKNKKESQFKKFNIDKVELEKLENALIQSQPSVYKTYRIFDVAYYMQGANIEKLGDAIIQTGDAGVMYAFATIFKEANIEKFKEKFMEMEDSGWLYLFQSHFKNYFKDTTISETIEAKESALKVLWNLMTNRSFSDATEEWSQINYFMKANHETFAKLFDEEDDEKLNLIGEEFILKLFDAGYVSRVERLVFLGILDAFRASEIVLKSNNAESIKDFSITMSLNKINIFREEEYIQKVENRLKKVGDDFILHSFREYWGRNPKVIISKEEEERRDAEIEWLENLINSPFGMITILNNWKDYDHYFTYHPKTERHKK